MFDDQTGWLYTQTHAQAMLDNHKKILKHMEQWGEIFALGLMWGEKRGLYEEDIALISGATDYQVMFEEARQCK